MHLFVYDPRLIYHSMILCMYPSLDPILYVLLGQVAGVFRIMNYISSGKDQVVSRVSLRLLILLCSGDDA